VANIKSQKKRIKTAEKARMRNRAVKSELKTAVRDVREAVDAGNGVEAYVAAQKACRLLDKAASKGVIHKNQAANRKSGVMKLANTVVTPEDIAKAPKPEKKAPKTVENSKKKQKAAARAAKAEELKKADAEKAKRREATLKAEKKAHDAKAKAEKAEAEAAAEAEDGAADAE
jgi:small subunit ribosomal protein S20